MHRDRLASRAIVYAILTFFALLLLVPFYWMLVSAVKTNAELVSRPPVLWPSAIQFRNFLTFVDQVPIVRVFLNSLIVSGGTTIAAVLFSAATGYALAKFRARGVSLIFVLFLTSYMVPPFVKVLPLYVGMVRLGLNNTLFGVILPFAVNIFGIFFMRQYCMSLPSDVIMVSRVDGATELGIFLRIVLPMIQPALAALGILLFLMTWNDFLWPLVMLSSARKMTIQVALATLVNLDYPTEYGIVMAGASLAILPVLILFVFLQQHILEGIALSGLKA